MNRILIALLATVAVSASAQQIVTRDVAQVTGVQPMMEQVRQPGRCYQVPGQQPQQQGPNVGMSILGGIVGGAVGSKIGQGDGRDAAIAAGAGLGAVWGAGQPQAGQYQQQCEPDGVTERVRGYRVTYNYQGYTGTTIVNYQPGQTIPVVITVAPDTAQGGGYPSQQRQGYQQQPSYQGQYQGPDHPAQRF